MNMEIVGIFVSISRYCVFAIYNTDSAQFLTRQWQLSHRYCQQKTKTANLYSNKQSKILKRCNHGLKLRRTSTVYEVKNLFCCVYEAGGDPLPGGCREDLGRAIHPTDGGHLQNSHRKARKVRKDNQITEKR